MEHSPSWEAVSSSANLEFTELLWNPYVHCCVSNSPPLIPIPSQENQMHSLTPYFFKLILILSHLLLDLRSGLRPSCYHNKTLKHNEFLYSSQHIKCHAYLCFLDLINQTLVRSSSPKTPRYAIFSGISLLPTVTIELGLGLTVHLDDKCYDRIWFLREVKLRKESRRTRACKQCENICMLGYIIVRV